MDAGRIETVGRLVEDQQLGVGEQAAGDAQPLSHPERVLLDPLVGAVGESDPGEGAVDAVMGGGFAGGGDDGEVLPPGEVSVEAWLLDDRSDAGECLSAFQGHRPSEQSHRAGRRSGEPEQHPDQRRLAGAVRPEVAEGDAAGDVQVDAVDGAPVTEALGQAGRLDDKRLPPVRPPLVFACAFLREVVGREV